MVTLPRDPGALPRTTAGDPYLSIGAVELLTGLSSSTLRSWERRLGFPTPERTGGGQRRYRSAEVNLVNQVLLYRQSGLSLLAAVDAVRNGAERDTSSSSLYAALRRLHPSTEFVNASFSVMRALSQAIEDECLAHAEHPILFGCFQDERTFRRAGRRWHELARQANTAVVLSNFAVTEVGPSLSRVALAADSPMLNEWSLICLDPGFDVVLTAWEVPFRGDVGILAKSARRFEAVISLDPIVVRDAAAHLATAVRAAGGPDLRQLLATLPRRSDEDSVRAGSLLRRFAHHAGSGSA